MSRFDDLLAANEQYAAQFRSGDLPGPAARGVAVVACMDSRVEPLRILGLELGDAKVLRNPGGQVTDEVLNALVLATHALGCDRVLVMQHTACRMAKLTEPEIHAAVQDSSGVDVRSLDFRTIADQRAALERDVQKVRSSPFVKAGTAVAGCLYDVASGRLEVVVPD